MFLTVAGQVVPESARALGLKHLDEHDVELHALETHPREGGQEEVVQTASDDAAEEWTRRLLDSHHEDHLGDEKTQHEVLVDRVAITLQVPEQTHQHGQNYQLQNLQKKINQILLVALT